jgi:Peptidase C39 family
MSIIPCSLWCFLPERKQEVTNIMKRTILLVCIAGILFAAIAVQNQASATNATSQNTLASIQSASLTPATAPGQIVRINQLDCAQYANQAECDTWAYSACSTAALVEVFNSYGRHLRIHDVLIVQARIGAITPALGLVEDAGIAHTAAQFGFQTNWGYRLNLNQIIQKANGGTPVIVGWPPSRYDGGHLIVVEGGTSSTVSIADSSRFNRHVLNRAQFLQWWAGFSAVVTPFGQGGQA